MKNVSKLIRPCPKMYHKISRYVTFPLHWFINLYLKNKICQFLVNHGPQPYLLAEYRLLKFQNELRAQNMNRIA